MNKEQTLNEVRTSICQTELVINVSVEMVSYKKKNRYVRKLYMQFSESLFGLSTGYSFNEPSEELKNILAFLFEDSETVKDFFSFNTVNVFKKELTETDCLHLFNLTTIQIFNRLLETKGFFPSYRNGKLYLLKHCLPLFGLPKKREDKILVPKKLQKYFKFIADDFEDYCNKYKEVTNFFEPSKEIEYRRAYPKNLSNFLDMGNGIDEPKYKCKCGFAGYYKDFILGSNAGFDGTFIRECPSCKRKRGDMYDRLFGGNQNEDFEVKLEVKDKHFFKIYI